MRQVESVVGNRIIEIPNFESMLDPIRTMRHSRQRTCCTFEDAFGVEVYGVTNGIRRLRAARPAVSKSLVTYRGAKKGTLSGPGSGFPFQARGPATS